MRSVIIVAACLLAAGCGSNTEQRSGSGALTGAGVGALVGGPVGAVVGAGVGAAGGAVAPEGADQAVNQGIKKEKTAANRELGNTGPGTGSRAMAGQVSRDDVRRVQTALRRDGEYKGRVDGIYGPKTEAAVRDWQQRNNVTADGRLDDQLVQRIAANEPAGAGASRTASGSSAPAGQKLSTDDVRQRLQGAGYSNVGDVRPWGDSEYTARADKGNQTWQLQVDARSGRVTSTQPVTASGSSMPPAPPVAPPAPANTTTGTSTLPPANAPAQPVQQQ